MGNYCQLQSTSGTVRDYVRAQTVLARQAYLVKMSPRIPKRVPQQAAYKFF